MTLNYDVFIRFIVRVYQLLHIKCCRIMIRWLIIGWRRLLIAKLNTKPDDVRWSFRPKDMIHLLTVSTKPINFFFVSVCLPPWVFLMICTLNVAIVIFLWFLFDHYDGCHWYFVVWVVVQCLMIKGMKSIFFLFYIFCDNRWKCKESESKKHFMNLSFWGIRK